MKYYMVIPNENEIHLPQVTNWYQDVPVSSFFQGKTWEIPFHNLLYVKECGWEAHYTKLLLSPVPLVHESILPVFHEYGLRPIEKQMVLLDIKEKKAELYFLLLLLRITANVCYDPVTNQRYIECDRRDLIDCEAFYIMEQQKCLLVCSLPLLESLIREGCTGITLKEIEIRKES